METSSNPGRTVISYSREGGVTVWRTQTTAPWGAATRVKAGGVSDCGRGERMGRPGRTWPVSRNNMLLPAACFGHERGMVEASTRSLFLLVLAIEVKQLRCRSCLPMELPAEGFLRCSLTRF